MNKRLGTILLSTALVMAMGCDLSVFQGWCARYDTMKAKADVIVAKLDANVETLPPSIGDKYAVAKAAYVASTGLVDSLCSRLTSGSDAKKLKGATVTATLDIAALADVYIAAEPTLPATLTARTARGVVTSAAPEVDAVGLKADALALHDEVARSRRGPGR